MDEQERRASFQEEEIERKLRLGQHMELFPEVLDAVEAEPFRERRWRQLMLALYRSGRTVEPVTTVPTAEDTLGPGRTPPVRRD
jgi:DNA-binding SARP family transcriptional activator